MGIITTRRETKERQTERERKRVFVAAGVKKLSFTKIYPIFE